MSPNNRIVAVAFAAVLLAASAAHAAVAAAASFDDKVSNAAAIILGRCVRSESRFDPTGRWILTYSTFNVEKTIKGTAAGEVTVVTPGGSVGHIHQETIGITPFREGDEHVVFLRNSRVGPTVLYFDQGVYDVATGERGEKVVAPMRSNIVKVDLQRGVAAAPADEPRSLQQFESDVHESDRVAQWKLRMEAMPQPPPQRKFSLVTFLLENKLLIALAAIGIALSAWQLWRR